MATTAAYRAGLWIALVGLVALGLVAVALRARSPDDAATQLEGLRQAILLFVYGAQETTPSRLVEIGEFDRRFREHPFPTLGHILAGGTFLLLIPLQLSQSIRTRFPAFHRWTGRVLIVLAFAAGVTALFFGLGMPFGGLAEAAIISAVILWLFVSLGRAYVAIRRGDVERHREWMLRVVAACIGVSVVRVVGAMVDVTLTPNGVHASVAFVIALWVGWAATFVVTEWWIRRTRPDYS